MRAALLVLACLAVPALPAAVSESPVNATFVDATGVWPATFEMEICPPGKESSNWPFNVTIHRDTGPDVREVGPHEPKHQWDSLSNGSPCNTSDEVFLWRIYNFDPVLSDEKILLAGAGVSSDPWSFSLEGRFREGFLQVREVDGS